MNVVMVRDCTPSRLAPASRTTTVSLSLSLSLPLPNSVRAHNLQGGCRCI